MEEMAADFVLSTVESVPIGKKTHSKIYVVRLFKKVNKLH